MTARPIEAEIRTALARLIDPLSGRDLVAAGMVGDIAVDGPDGARHVRIVLEVDPARGPSLGPLAQAAETAVARLAGVASARAILTAHAERPTPTAPAPAGSQGGQGGHGIQGLKPLRQSPTREGPIPGVDRLIAIGSGKGGVGKSTVAANLAVALAQAGRRVGLLDADVYGPSQPRMMGVTGTPASPDGSAITPLRAHGVTVMSIGFLAAADKALVWRGPMLMSALQQMLRQVSWGRLDTLLVDLPPGTGDIQLTLAQRAEVTGAIVVSTPQDVALIDARKAIDMFRRTEVPILGLIENMSTFACPNCGHETHLFGHGGAKAEAERIGAPFLGEIPLRLELRLSGDAGTPILVAEPDSPAAVRFRTIARGLIERGLG